MKQWSLWAFLFLGSVLLTACGGGSDSSSSETGELQLMLTDAEEDFLTYQVTLQQVQLERRDGTTVNVLPLATEVDFVQYQDLNEVFAVMSIPAGRYESVTLSMDYTDAEIVIQDDTGTSYMADVVDGDGQPVTTLDVDLDLGDGDTINIRPGRLARLTLDLDLAASNHIVSFEPALVEVEPFIMARAIVDEDREHRVRGLLKRVDEAGSSISLNVRPLRLRRGGFGDFTFQVDNDTLYEIDGTEYSGDTGLSAMAALATDTPVVAFGEYDARLDGQLASHVIAGSSVAWSGKDVLKGVVRARNGNTLTIGGAVVEPDDQAAAFLTEITLMVDSETPVTGYRLGDATIDNLSVGQRILALGQFKSDQFEDDQFDATDGLVRMKLNRIVGQVNAPMPLALDLAWINRRPVARYDFAGTGMSDVEDADPANYEIDTATLDTSGITTDEWIQVRGYPTAFGSAPEDFDAVSVINPSLESAIAKFVAHWEEGVAGGVTVQGNDLVLDTANARSYLHLRGLPAVVTAQFELTSITGDTNEGRFALLTRGEGIRLYRNYIDFVTAVSAKLNAGHTVRHLSASGSYSDSSERMVATGIMVRL
ncbi:DUF4382 domain-containing protein [Marinobacter alexandrii]|uniref:DUF4382 domain-containing protein n=1 Tax=Marinobacter alexandrii TaxID=2570351 RepID=UPI001109FF0B|nr:DUF4382 domain-containing protein [Marinobacter alexandrii]